MAAAKKLQSEGLVDELEKLIRTGEIHPAKKILLSFNIKSLSRPTRAPLAQIARRVNLPLLGLKILAPIVRHQLPLKLPPQPEEIIAYSSNLIRIGSIGEAMHMLSQIDSDEYPEVLLQKNFANAISWDYQKNIRILEKYIKSDKISSYQRDVGEMNLAAALVATHKYEQSHLLISNLLSNQSHSKNYPLMSVIYMLATQVALGKKNIAEANRCIELAQSILPVENKIYTNLIHKWKTVVKLYHKGPSEKALKDLAAVRSEAKSLNIWETVRACDFYLATFTENQELFNRVYMGTPYPEYRKNILILSEGQFSIPDTYVWRADPSTEGPTLQGKVIDILHEMKKTKSTKLHFSDLTFSAIKLLCRDFYRPIEMGAIFSLLYKNEYFNINTSPKRVSSLINRVRQWLNSRGLPFTVTSQNKLFSIQFYDNSGIKLYTEKSFQSQDINQEFFDLLKSHWPYQAFSSRQAIEYLKITRHRFELFAKWAKANKKIHSGGVAAGKNITLKCKHMGTRRMNARSAHPLPSGGAGMVHSKTTPRTLFTFENGNRFRRHFRF